MSSFRLKQQQWLALGGPLCSRARPQLPPLLKTHLKPVLPPATWTGDPSAASAEETSKHATGLWLHSEHLLQLHFFGIESNEKTSCLHMGQAIWGTWSCARCQGQRAHQSNLYNVRVYSLPVLSTIVPPTQTRHTLPNSLSTLLGLQPAWWLPSPQGFAALFTERPIQFDTFCPLWGQM